jgi:hypothetical protein
VALIGVPGRLGVRAQGRWCGCAAGTGRGRTRLARARPKERDDPRAPPGSETRGGGGGGGGGRRGPPKAGGGGRVGHAAELAGWAERVCWAALVGLGRRKKEKG